MGRRNFVPEVKKSLHKFLPMTTAIPYLLECKPHDGIIDELKKQEMATVLRNSLAIYEAGICWKLILSMSDKISKIVEAQGAERLTLNDLLVLDLVKRPDNYILLFGNPKATKFL